MVSFALVAGVVGVLLNIALSHVGERVATPQERKPKSAKKLHHKSQAVHMLVHHKQVLVTSSVIVFTLVVLSIIIAQRIQPML